MKPDITSVINEYAFANLQRKLNEANARIVEFEDIKAGHLKIQNELREKLDLCIEALKFYEDEGSWNWHYANDERSQLTSNINDDFGKRAQKVLEKIKG
ncbi:MAG TPA: hypothetical protein PKI14_01335 [Fervidobacterium sp.]|nr:hypothetical protein [Fervidobacterium sp.]